MVESVFQSYEEMRASSLHYPFTSLFLDRWSESEWDSRSEFDNSKMEEILELQLRPLKDSLVAMVESSEVQRAGIPTSATGVVKSGGIYP